MTWEFKPDIPIYIQLVEQMKLRIVSGFYSPGGKLPSVRDLAGEAGVNPNTMQRALSELERDELVFAQRTSGRFITEDQAMIDKIKESLAAAQIAEFLEKMKSLGLSGEDTINLMRHELAKAEDARKE